VAADAATTTVDDVGTEPSVAEDAVVADGEAEAAPEADAEAEALEPAPEPEAEVAAEAEAEAVEPEPAPEPEAEAAPEPTLEADADADAEADAEGDAGDGAGEAPAAPPKPEPVAVVAPKERRRLKRAAKEPATRGPLSPEDRQAERDALRAKNATARRHGRAKSRAAKPASAAAPPVAVEHAVGRPRDRQGIVVSDKAAKTITVRVDTSRRHRRYKKIVRSSKTLHAHDEHNEAHEGDLVRVVETRPLSATKRWRLLEVLERAK
ncbi:MAG: 30S ribosomal protein S17, partial [Solirubrobacteraceae bacterium]